MGERTAAGGDRPARKGARPGVAAEDPGQEGVVMKPLECPHCHEEQITVSKVPNEVVVVTPCPACHELVVVFRRKAIGLNRTILKSGTMEEKKTHLANVIVEFLEPDLIESALGEILGGDDEGETRMHDLSKGHRRRKGPRGISEEEINRFVVEQLPMLDDPEYFRDQFEDE